MSRCHNNLRGRKIPIGIGNFETRESLGRIQAAEAEGAWEMTGKRNVKVRAHRRYRLLKVPSSLVLIAAHIRRRRDRRTNLNMLNAERRFMMSKSLTALTSTNNASPVSSFTYRQQRRLFPVLSHTNALEPIIMSYGAPQPFPPLADVLNTISIDFHAEFLNWMRGCAVQNDRQVSLTGMEAVITQLLDTIPPCGSVSTAEAARKMAPVPSVLESIGEVLSIDNWREPSFVWTVVSGLLRLMAVMESWKKESEEAASLQAKAFDRIVDILRNLGGTFVKGVPQNAQRTQLREMFEECLHAIHELMETQTLSYPIHVRILQKPRLLKPGDLAANNKKSTCCLQSSSDALCFMVTLLEIWTSFMLRSTQLQWFLHDFGQRLAQETRSCFDYCMSAVCNLEPVVRSEGLVRIMSLIPSLRSLSENELYHWHYILLRFRLFQGPNSGWEHIDRYLAKELASSSFVAPSKSDFREIVRLLASGRWPKSVEVYHFVGRLRIYPTIFIGMGIFPLQFVFASYRAKHSAFLTNCHRLRERAQ
ncbi:uncharacterized protein BT62DRAFT_786098 [Guyanagaster necrorhizus]|uniref:Uncharacterized protein n=1 Tax=Guyanagaster necrorhizus TaxID=856835 RepID=A0A9P7VVE6_9AGAR|nr:uncharacterized protein BT62DRAFT_786098 [Guyanagaster necrorhizus MCA 3950]KAG7447639.1 hypothetical protein BT62DRAFT_786098 [Guyanagaster necrorhizus MCA 3950]